MIGLSVAAQRALSQTVQECRTTGGIVAEPQDMLVALSAGRETVAGALLDDFGVGVERLRELVERDSVSILPEHVPLSSGMIQIIDLARAAAMRSGRGEVGTAELLLALIEHPAGQAVALLTRVGTPVDQLRSALADRLGEPDAEGDRAKHVTVHHLHGAHQSFPPEWKPRPPSAST